MNVDSFGPTGQLPRAGCVFLVFLSLLFGIATFSPTKAEAPQRSPLTIETQDGRQHAFLVELAVTDQEQALGLMFRPSLAADAGMLFVYPYEQEILMWMKNTLIPLDMIFADAAGRIVSIAHRTVPHSLEIVSSRRLAKLVLEVNGGTADRLGLQPGDLLRHEAIGNAD